jgi:hypothetical protein
MFLRLGGLLFVIALVVWLWAIFDAATTERTRVRNLPKLAWLAVIVVFTWVGALAWAVFGRPRGRGEATRVSGGSLFGSASGNRPSPRRGGRPLSGPIGPDDDPDFLRKI